MTQPGHAPGSGTRILEAQWSGAKDLSMRVTLLHNTWFNIVICSSAYAVELLASNRGLRFGDWTVAVVFAFYSVYCIQNFIGCREVHCGITGPGFSTAAVLMALRRVGHRRLRHRSGCQSAHWFCVS